jgi:hypothetical protein
MKERVEMAIHKILPHGMLLSVLQVSQNIFCPLQEISTLIFTIHKQTKSIKMEFPQSDEIQMSS